MTAFLKLTPELVALMGFLWENWNTVKEDPFVAKILKVPELGIEMTEIFENTATAGGPYEYGVEIDGMAGHRLAIGLDLVSRSGKLKAMLDEVCIKKPQADDEVDDGTNGPDVCTVTSTQDMLAISEYGRSYVSAGDAIQDLVDDKFDKEYIGLKTILDRLVATVQ